MYNVNERYCNNVNDHLIQRPQTELEIYPVFCYLSAVDLCLNYSQKLSEKNHTDDEKGI